MAAQMLRQARGRRLQRRPGTRRYGQDLKRPIACAACATLRGLFKHDMRIGASDTQTVYACSAGMRRTLPGHQLVVYHERRIVKINGRIWCLVAEGWRHLLVMQRQARLDQAGNACCRVQMTDVGLD